jgi:hypothetical protein
MSVLALLFAFHFGKVTFEPVDVFAYQTDAAKPETIVVFTSYKIDRPAVLAAINTPGAFVMQSGEKGSFVLARLTAPDKCSVSGWLAPTAQQIDVGTVAGKTTAATATRVAGECWTAKPGKIFDDAYDFHLTYDAPITAIPKPAKLAAGGGEAGAAYVALVKAIQASSWDGAHAHLPPEQSPAQKPKDMKFYFEGLALNYPKTVTVDGGLMKGDRANIDIHGIDHDGKKIKGIVALKKTGGVWQVQEQNLFFDM